MHDHDIKQQIATLERAVEATPPDRRQVLRAQITHLIETLRGREIAVPERLSLLQEQVDREEEDFFDNMPV
ncbi:MAG: hypothetical protein AB8B60_19775 [Sulfitobacter sp.]